MTNRYFTCPAVLQRLHAGALGPHINAFAAILSEQGYARATGRVKLRRVASLSRWLQRKNLAVHDLDEHRMNQFLQYLRRKGRGRNPFECTCPATLRQLLEYLRSAGAISPPAPAALDSPLDRVLHRYTEYLKLERGFTPVGLQHYLPIVRRFLSERFGTSPIRLSELRPTDISGFVVRAANTGSAKNAQMVSTALRSFLRFLYLREEIPTDLAVCVPSLPSWRLAGLPESLEPQQVESLLKGFDRTAVLGKRNYAILLLLVRLGLRAGEVTNLTLEEINWETGELTIRGKGDRVDRLPLPQDVGKALVEYLRHGRPPCPTRRVFVRTKAPHRGFASSGQVSDIVQQALERASIQTTHKGAHLLRHSLATNMLRKGASLGEIGEILRHRLITTTEIYAKVDLVALRALAQPWPGGAA